MTSKSLLVLLASAVPLAAQWLNYPTLGVPRTPSGLPNLGALASRAADGHPDFSGIWEADHNVPCPPTGCWDMRRTALDTTQFGIVFDPAGPAIGREDTMQQDCAFPNTAEHLCKTSAGSYV